MRAMIFCAIRSMLILFGAVANFSAAADSAELKVGDKAPAFTCDDDSGRSWKSDEHYGKKIVVVYFYPAAMTPGCTKQSCGFRDDMKKLADKGVEVVGVSGDEVAGLKLFKQAHELNFALLADSDGAVAKKFGVPLGKGGEIKRTVEGKEYTLKRGVTASRWTFVVGRDGRIALKNTKVNAAEDSKAIMKLVESLAAEK